MLIDQVMYYNLLSGQSTFIVKHIRQHCGLCAILNVVILVKRSMQNTIGKGR